MDLSPAAVTMPPDDMPRAQAASEHLPRVPDVFLSYAREDRSRAEWLAGVLTEQGWSVWSDSRVISGQLWKDEIHRALAGAKCVVVLWSDASVQSHWVLDEAGEGLRREVLVPALLDDVEIPLGFRQVQAVNLAGNDEARDRAVNDLIAGVARIIGGVRHPLVRPPKSRRRLKTAGFGLAAVFPAAAALFLSLYPTRDTAIDLELKASELSFVSTKDQDMTRLMTISTLEAAGLGSIEVPHGRGRPAQLLAATNGKLAIRLAAGDAAAAGGTITLTPVSLSRGAHVTLAGHDGRRYRISFNRSAIPVGLNVQGPIHLAFAGGEAQLIDFGTPKPMLLEPDDRGAEFGITLSDGGQQALLSSPLEVNALSLVRIDETVETRRTAVSTVSTIVSGTLRLEALGDRQRTVSAGEILRFGESHGEIRSLHLADGGLLMRFHGRVRRMESCSGSMCESWMPTHLESLAVRHPAWLVGFAVVYLLSLIAAGLRWLKRW